MSLVELYRSSVQTWETDGMGHMNVQFYSEKATNALAALSLQLGHGRDEIERTGARLVAEDHHIRFLREQRPGAPIFIRGGVVEADANRLTCYFEMLNTVSGDVAATFFAHASLRSDTDRTQVPISDAMIAKAEAVKVEVPPHGSPRGLELTPPRSAPSLGDAEEMGLLTTFQGEVMRDWCVTGDFLATRRFMGIVSDSIPNLLAQTRGDDRSKDSTTGGAALEYRFVYRDAPKVSDVLTLRSGLKEVTDKTYTWAHWLFDVETGSCVATAEAVAIALDLVARKAIPIPPDMKTGLEKFVVPGLGV
ncbi:thioesterase family protein [Parvibaculaceae bacterium PLY_AMNH_Bact1]|nr:thioesterase family protein [Parvibaculaceae bacterium PLY_AMNH_Bact1]